MNSESTAPISIHTPWLVKKFTRSYFKHPGPYSADELGSVDKLSVFAPGDCSELGKLPHLNDLSLKRIDQTSLESIPESVLRRLNRLTLERCDVTDVSRLQVCEQLSWFKLAATPVESLESLRGLSLDEVQLLGTRVHDLSPLQACPRLRRLVVRGCPLGDVSFGWAREQADAGSHEVMTEAECELAREIEARQLPLVIGHNPLFQLSDVSWIDFMGANRLVEFTGNPPGLPAEQALETIQRRDDWTVEELWQAIVKRSQAFFAARRAANPPQPLPPRFNWAAHIERADAQTARGWVEHSALPEADKAVLVDFIERFPTLHYERLDEAFLDELDKVYDRPAPGWLRTLMGTLYTPRAIFALKRLPRSRALDLRDAETGLVEVSIEPRVGTSESEVIGRTHWYPMGSLSSGYSLGVDVRADGERGSRTVYLMHPLEMGGDFTVASSFAAYDDYLDIFRLTQQVIAPAEGHSEWQPLDQVHASRS